MHSLCEIRQVMVDLRGFEESLRKKTALSLNEALCLCQVENGLQEPGALARSLDLSPSRLSRIIESLENRRLIQRSLSESDRRGVTISLTEEGKASVKELHGIRIALPAYLDQSV